MDKCPCGYETDEYCIECEQPICREHTYVSDTCQDDIYCQNCYVADHELWIFYYITTQGDILKGEIETPKNTHPFKIPKLAREHSGYLYWRIGRYWKVRGDT